ncbi:RND family transporter [Caldicellulosiruptoraceae bacterium PP1]
MKQVGIIIVKLRIPVIVLAVLLLLPSLYGMQNTKVKYDLTTYLPSNLDSIKGQKILDEKFSQGTLSMLIIENMPNKNVKLLKDKIQKVDGVESVLWVDSILDTTFPDSFLPNDIKKIFFNKNSTMLFIKFKGSSSDASTQKAIDRIKELIDKKGYLSGSAAISKDINELSLKDVPIYTFVAVVLVIILLTLTMDSFFVPLIILTNIGFAILYNLGTNYLLGDISYITKSLAAVLQLGVTLDYSIFLFNRYKEEKLKTDNKLNAMAEAISKTATAVLSSALTTVAGFLALVIMKFGIGRDLGIVLAKGVFISIFTTITILPSLILILDKLTERFKTVSLLPKFTKISQFVVKNYKAFVVILVILFLPALYGRNNVGVYYDLLKALPSNAPSYIATEKMEENFDIATLHTVVVSDKIGYKNIASMINEIEKINGITNIFAIEKFIGPSIPESFLPEAIKRNFQNQGYKLIMIASKNRSTSQEGQKELLSIERIAKRYDKDAILTGEGVLTRDIMKVTSVDLKNVDVLSVLAIFIIILIAFKSISIPVLLVGCIEFAILINFAISFFTKLEVPFIGYIIMGAIQLGSTVDYAILLTSRFEENIKEGLNKYDAVKNAIKSSGRSILTSALGFFLATFAIALISKMDMVKNICLMLSRGAIISMIVILTILPALLIVSEKVIKNTTIGLSKQ